MNIELVAENLGISTRDELLTIEDSYIRKALRADPKLCLNRNKPHATERERLIRERHQELMWNKVRKDLAKLPPGSTKTTADLVREYYRSHKNQINRQLSEESSLSYVDCECGWRTTRARMKAHLESETHAREIQQARVISWTHLYVTL